MENYILDNRLLSVKNMGGAMSSFVFLLFEMIVESEPDSILEIGVQYGQSTKAMLLALDKIKKGKLVSIDHKDRNNILSNEDDDLRQYWNFYQGSSHDIASVEKVIPHGPYDILFIDGDHTYEGVKADFFMYEPLVKPGGLILLHDVVNRRAEISKYWDEIQYKKIVFGWGHAKRRVIPGIGIVQKPGINEPGYNWVKRNALRRNAPLNIITS